MCVNEVQSMYQKTLYPEALHNRQIGISWESVGLLGGVVHTIEAS